MKLLDMVNHRGIFIEYLIYRIADCEHYMATSGLGQDWVTRGMVIDLNDESITE